MGKLNFIRGSFLCAVALAMTPSAIAEKGAPHTFGVSSNYDEVTLKWNSPESAKELKWNTSYAYNGNDGIQRDPQRLVELWGGSIFE